MKKEDFYYSVIFGLIISEVCSRDIGFLSKVLLATIILLAIRMIGAFLVKYAS